MDKGRKRAILITPMLQPYRISFYSKLSQKLKDICYLYVYHGTKTKEDGRPPFVGEVPFKEKGFPIVNFKILSYLVVFNIGMFRSLRKDNPDLIIVQGISGDISLRLIVRWAYRQKKKLIFWTCGWEPDRVKGWQLSLKNKLVSSFFSKANSHLTYSSTATKYVQSMGVDKSIITTCYNGIETDDLLLKYTHVINKAKELKTKYDLDNSLTFLYVGGLIGEKKVSFLLDAFFQLRKKYSKIKLIIIGDGPQQGLIKKQISEHLDPNILYLGRIVEDVDPYFAACDCFVLPGIGGLALNQAMFWGKPCIVSKADGTEDDLVIPGFSGYRFIENNLESLVSVMEKRINEEEGMLNFMSDNARKIILTKSNVNNMVQIFSDTIRTYLS